MRDSVIELNAHENQSGSTRVSFAEGLILQLPKDHDGRNTWLLNYGVSDEAWNLRKDRGISFDMITGSAALRAELVEL